MVFVRSFRLEVSSYHNTSQTERDEDNDFQPPPPYNPHFFYKTKLCCSLMAEDFRRNSSREQSWEVLNEFGEGFLGDWVVQAEELIEKILA
jgi:hypothetical protein